MIVAGSRAAAPARFARRPLSVGPDRPRLAAAVVLVALLGPCSLPTRRPSSSARRSSGPSRASRWARTSSGRDVLSRVLWGGRTVIALAGAATLLAYLVGVPIGLLAGYSRSFVDPLLMRIMDVFLAFPPIILLLVLATGVGPQSLGARRRRRDHARAGDLAHRPDGHARGVRARLRRGGRGPRRATPFMLRREILPEHRGADPRRRGHSPDRLDPAGRIRQLPRLGLQPPAADWALMISENRGGLTLQAWASVVPGVLIAR